VVPSFLFLRCQIMWIQTCMAKKRSIQIVWYLSIQIVWYLKNKKLGTTNYCSTLNLYIAGFVKDLWNSGDSAILTSQPTVGFLHFRLKTLGHPGWGFRIEQGSQKSFYAYVFILEVGTHDRHRRASLLTVKLNHWKKFSFPSSHGSVSLSIVTHT